MGQTQKAIPQTRGSSHTATANDLENVRDQGFKAFRDVVKAGTQRVNESWAEKSRKLERIIRSHGWRLYAEGAKIQTAIMTSLKTELDKKENQKLIKDLAIAEWYVEMNESDDNYRQVLNDRFDEETQKEKYDHSELYKAMRAAGDDLCKAVEVFYKMTGNETYTEMANGLNTITEKYMTTARGRKTRNENEKLAVSENE